MIETLYRTKSPSLRALAERWYEISMGEETVDYQLGYFVRETECWWDPREQHMVRVQYTLSPRGGFPTAEEAELRYQLQRIFRAVRGFVHSFAPRYDPKKTARYSRVQIPIEFSVTNTQAEMNQIAPSRETPDSNTGQNSTDLPT